MSKVLKITEVIQALADLEKDIDDKDQYLTFGRALADVLTEHAGGIVCFHSGDDDEGDDLGLCFHFDIDEKVPADGGVYKNYDTDIVWKDGFDLDQVFTIGDQPATCPHCGARTDFTEDENGRQKHTCLGCGFKFIGEFDEDEDD